MRSTKPTPWRAITGGAFFSLHSLPGLTLILVVLLCIVLGATLYLYAKTKEMQRLSKSRKKEFEKTRLAEYLSEFDSTKLASLRTGLKPALPAVLLFSAAFLSPFTSFAQAPVTSASILKEPGMIILMILILIPVLFGIILMGVKISRIATQFRTRQSTDEEEQFKNYLATLSKEEVEEALARREQALNYRPDAHAMTGTAPASDKRGLLHNINTEAALPLTPPKKRAASRPPVDPALARLVVWYIGCAAFWLLFGTTVGEYIGIKFVAPDADHVSWLSFGRLRPVHTNAVFWGWASLGMLGLGYYIVPRVSNTALFSIKKGWYSLVLINAAVVLGSCCLMGGINNGGGEYREYIWPVMLLFGVGIVLTLENFYRTIGRRTTHEIYISNWYIVSALIFVLVITLVAYLPWWQDGLGETIVQGYWMHQGVGMWFMLFTLGIVYYFLPQQLNKPIYSYSLGILAFWTQILFYTVIGTHHFVFSSIPWWLQTTAIVGSVGMIIPVTAGTTNFLLTIRGSWHSVASSYTLPFFLAGIIFYFTGSMQGTAEAFRSTNLVWHFTDFTVAHSHLTMYGIISFFLWAGIYAVLPRLTGKEAPQSIIGAHFWLALIGLLFYTVPLMIGGTLKGVLWAQGRPFIDGVVLMAPYWLWRAIGGSLMWLSHLLFCYNLYRMVAGSALFTRDSSFKKQQAHGVLSRP
ncbi:cbb3-type cytochrome c oxidase subunit I [Puia dinghuensis]|uniref:Cytochrome oxidase subunit I n=1 Tax=Puia dinghuensis TaxID=1792502 RepID=A0A8J2UE16_9BACT|nr:cbb3-type cytochrome c oxidase subunit I [Puia dinghuensis]GGB03400.1 cytochrome oxidase subunit I [Puia dinghuensis]